LYPVKRDIVEDFHFDAPETEAAEQSIPDDGVVLS
jgi:hypothetical protein